MKNIALVLYLLFTSFSIPVFAQLPDSLARIFQYTKSKPAFEVDSSFKQDDILVEQITYSSTDKFLTSAFVVKPALPANSPLIIFQHWGEGDKTEFLDEAISYAKKGFISVLPDGPWLCPNTSIKSFKRQGFEMYRQCVLNVRTAIDLAEESFGVDSKRITFVGHSFGCNAGAILSGTETRISNFIFMAGTISTTRNVLHSESPDFVEWRTGDAKQFNEWLIKLRPLDAELYLPHKTKPCLIQIALNDEYISAEENDKFIDISSLPKTVKKYNTGHFLNEEAREDRMIWVLKQKSN